MGPITSIPHISNGHKTLDEDVPVLDRKVTVDLVGMASLSIGDGIRDHL